MDYLIELGYCKQAICRKINRNGCIYYILLGTFNPLVRSSNLLRPTSNHKGFRHLRRKPFFRSSSIHTCFADKLKSGPFFLSDLICSPGLNHSERFISYPFSLHYFLSISQACRSIRIDFSFLPYKIMQIPAAGVITKRGRDRG